MNGNSARSSYVSKLESFKGVNDAVKVLTGMRRCGKTSILEQYAESLKASGVPVADIIYLDFEKRSGQDYSDSVKLDALLAGKVAKDRQTYLLLNNILAVRDWNQSILRMLSFGRCDIYLVAPRLADISDGLSEFRSDVRLEEIKVYPLSFKEYLEMYPSDDVEARFLDYAKYGGMPEVDPSFGERVCDAQLEGIYNTIVLNDLVLKNKDDPRKLIAVTKYLYTHIGKQVTVGEIAKACGIMAGSAERMVSDLESAYLICRADRYDINVGNAKGHPFVLYATDNGIRDFALKYDTEYSLDLAMENIVYLELKRRGYKVRAGSVHEDGTTFTAIKGESYEFYTVVSSARSTSCEVKDIIDNANRVMLTLDRDIDMCGKAKLVNICDWLLQ